MIVKCGEIPGQIGKWSLSHSYFYLFIIYFYVHVYHVSIYVCVVIRISMGETHNLYESARLWGALLPHKMIIQMHIVVGIGVVWGVTEYCLNSA